MAYPRPIESYNDSIVDLAKNPYRIVHSKDASIVILLQTH